MKSNRSVMMRVSPEALQWINERINQRSVRENGKRSQYNTRTEFDSMIEEITNLRKKIKIIYKT